MKKILSIAALAAISTSAFASDYYIQYNQTLQSAESKKIFGIQPLEELVGKTGTRHALGAGKIYNDIFWIGGEVGYTPDYKEYDVRANIKLQTAEPVLFGFISPYFASNVGFFTQKPDSHIKLSTHANVMDYILSNSAPTPSMATYESKPIGFSIGAELGMNMQITKSISAYTAYEYQMKMVQFSYRLDDKQEALNSVSTAQRNNNVKFGLNYKF